MKRRHFEQIGKEGSLCRTAVGGTNTHGKSRKEGAGQMGLFQALRTPLRQALGGPSGISGSQSDQFHTLNLEDSAVNVSGSIPELRGHAIFDRMSKMYSNL